jgi:allophanate hydrolase
VFHADTKLPVGAKSLPQPALAPLSDKPGDGEIAIAVVGAHLSGMALNRDLQALDGRLLKATTTAPDYKFYALNGTTPPKPGLLRVADGTGAAIALEIWALSDAAFGQFVASLPEPMSIGTLRLSDGSSVKGFLVEAKATEDARDISSYGGWRAYMAEQK